MLIFFVLTVVMLQLVKYHPDKVATLGADVQKAAEEKFKAISQAYEAICRERGI